MSLSIYYVLLVRAEILFFTPRSLSGMISRVVPAVSPSPPRRREPVCKANLFIVTCHSVVPFFYFYLFRTTGSYFKISRAWKGRLITTEIRDGRQGGDFTLIHDWHFYLIIESSLWICRVLLWRWFLLFYFPFAFWFGN